jgi:hypothetical protein
MGYSTKFKGALRFDSEITVPQMVKLDSILREDVRDHPEWNVPKDLYLSYVDLEITNDLTGLKWDGSEKTYGMADLIALVIRLMQEEFPDFSLSGTLFAQGDEVGDVYTIVVDKNNIREVAFGDE